MKNITFYQHRDTLEVCAVMNYPDRTFSIFLLNSDQHVCMWIPSTGQYLDVHQKSDYIKESRRLNKNNSLVKPLYEGIIKLFND